MGCFLKGALGGAWRLYMFHCPVGLKNHYMKKVYNIILIILMFSCFYGNTQPMINSADGLRIPGNWNGFVNSNGMGGNFDCELITVGERRWTTIFEYTGITGSQEFKIVSGGANPWANQWYFGVFDNINDVTKDLLQTYTFTNNESSSNNRISLENGNWYSFNWQDDGYAATSAIFMETSAEPVDIINVEGSFKGVGLPMDITATLSASKSIEEVIYIRYTTNNFSSSGFVQMSCTGIECDGTIPGASVGSENDYKFYILSTTVSSINHSNADMLTIKLNNNGGMNYEMGSPAFPVHLTHFTAHSKDKQVDLNWRTSTEQNNDHFELQRSADGRAWSPIGKIAGRGTTQQEQAYHYTDKRPLPGLSYYRLKQVDYDGAFEYHGPVSVRRGIGDGGMKVFPNPVGDRLYLVLPDADPEGQLRLVSSLGQEVGRWPAAAATDGLPVADLPAGVYLLQWLDGRGVARAEALVVK